MKTLILRIDNKTNASKIVEAVKLFKGVKQAHILSPTEEKKSLKAESKSEDKEDMGLLAAIKEGRTGKYVNTGEFINKLRK